MHEAWNVEFASFDKIGEDLRIIAYPKRGEKVNYQADVCIVGAGPAGALLSYLLAKKGLSVILLEQNVALGQAFRGEHLNEEGEAVLKATIFSKQSRHSVYYEWRNLSIMLVAEHLKQFFQMKQ